ncbi:hypothetical protein G3260_003724 [Streptomyces albus]|uniref:EsaB/YukD family protein n=1 Tax=Streptomyces albus TaxID=1888 RepID=UPI0013B47D27|nr:EsaB/YukD family protein [Streptomyces albus]QID37325.1 hypothetical protein G3260_003724 [Streptomyces albus]
MPDDRCRVTVVGERKSVDLALPVRAPIAEYVPRLAGLCGQEESEAMPPVWSLAEAGAPPFPPGDSLESAGVLDGAVLYLRDCRADEDLDLSVTDLDDQIAAANEDAQLWNARNRALSVVVAGLFASVLATVPLGLRHQAGPAVVMFFLIGVASALTAWYATRKSWPVPAGVRQVMALAAVPLTVAAGTGLPLDGRAVSDGGGGARHLRHRGPRDTAGAAGRRPHVVGRRGGRRHAAAVPGAAADRQPDRRAGAR